MSRDSNKQAFTLLELILVIVILGIVSSIGSELIVNVYQRYILQRAQHRASIETELVAMQIANRLAGAIPGTSVRRTALVGGTIEDVVDNMILGGDNYTTLQWVGADIDSFNAAPTPGWSGFCDVDNLATTNASLETPGSNLNLTDAIFANLSQGGGSGALAVYFPNDSTAYLAATPDADTVTLLAPATLIKEHYKLAWSSYALEVVGGDLLLHYNFLPTRATDVVNQKTSVLMENISTFKFRGYGRTIRFKICKQEDIGEAFNITVCKEKAVF